MSVKIRKLAETDVVVLGLLLEKPSYGYELEQRVSTRGMRNWTRMEQSSIYNSLRRLERNGLVRSEKKEAGGRLRRFFYPTDEGASALQAEVYTLLSTPAKELSDFDLALGNIYALSRDEAIDALSLYLKSLEKSEAFLETNARRMRTFGVPIAAWLFERPLAESRARAEWIKGFMQELQNAPFPEQPSSPSSPFSPSSEPPFLTQPSLTDDDKTALRNEAPQMRPPALLTLLSKSGMAEAELPGASPTEHREPDAHPDKTTPRDLLKGFAARLTLSQPGDSKDKGGGSRKRKTNKKEKK
jgi:DNA-binding PadR family transcriptional regulator